MALAGEPGLVKMVVEQCGDWAEGWGAGEVGEGVMRLAGAGRTTGQGAVYRGTVEMDSR